MMRIAAPLPPDWRWLKVKKAIEDGVEPEDPFLADVYAVALEKKTDANINGALYLYSIPYERDVVVGFLLSGSTMPQAAQGTGVPAEHLQMFERLFMDRRTFNNKMEWRLYAQYYSENIAIPAVRRQIEAGVSYGPTVLLDHWTMGNEVVEVPEREIISRWTMTAYTKALVARNAPIGSLAAREAFRWGAMAVKSVMDLRNARSDNDNANLDAVLAIEQRRAVVTPEELGISLTDIVH